VISARDARSTFNHEGADALLTKVTETKESWRNSSAAQRDELGLLRRPSCLMHARTRENDVFDKLRSSVSLSPGVVLPLVFVCFVTVAQRPSWSCLAGGTEAPAGYFFPNSGL